MKRIIPILMTLLLLFGCAKQSAENTYRQITMEEAVTMMEEETGYIILDVRTPQEYNEKAYSRCYQYCKRIHWHRGYLCTAG